MEVWKKAMDLVELIYKTTRQPSFSKDYVLIDQIRRASVPVASNIAEGMERDGNKELIHFLYISKGSAGELICQLDIAYRLQYLNKEQFTEMHDLAAEINKSLRGFIKY